MSPRNSRRGPIQAARTFPIGAHHPTPARHEPALLRPPIRSDLLSATKIVAIFLLPNALDRRKMFAQGMSAARDGPQKWARIANRVLPAERLERVARWVGRRRPADRALCGLPQAAVVPQRKEVIRCQVINRGGCGNAVNVAAYRSPLKLARRRPYQSPAGLFMPGASSCGWPTRCAYRRTPFPPRRRSTSTCPDAFCLER